MKFPFVSIIFQLMVSTAILSAGTNTIILQQGANGYEGCFDTYAASYTIEDSLNIGSSDVLKIEYLSC